MRIAFLLLLACLVSFTSCNQKPKKAESVQDSVVTSEPVKLLDSLKPLEDVINGFVKAYEQRNSNQVNTFIHPDLGLTVIHRPGVSDVFNKIDSFDFENPTPSYFAYPSVKNSFKLSYNKLPDFDCGTEKWSKTGFFVDTTSVPNQLSQIIEFEREFEPNKYSVKQVKDIKNAERNSYRVILTTENPLIFHVQKYKGFWYVTVLDRAYAGCDA
jgi:hypothetical protein